MVAGSAAAMDTHRAKGIPLGDALVRNLRGYIRACPALRADHSHADAKGLLPSKQFEAKAIAPLPFEPRNLTSFTQDGAKPALASMPYDSSYHLTPPAGISAEREVPRPKKHACGIGMPVATADGAVLSGGVGLAVEVVPLLEIVLARKSILVRKELLTVEQQQARKSRRVRWPDEWEGRMLVAVREYEPSEVDEPDYEEEYGASLCDTMWSQCPIQ